MPFIYIRSLPFKGELDFADVLEGLCRDFAEGARIGADSVAATWEILPAGRYAHGGATTDRQPMDSHPILAELVAPGAHDGAAVDRMLHTLAASISARTGVPMNNVFIHCREVHSGRVYEMGGVARW